MYAGDVGGGRPSARSDAAGLGRAGWLSVDGDVVGAAAGDRGLKGEGYRAGTGDGEVIAAVIVQKKPSALETKDRTADGEGARWAAPAARRGCASAAARRERTPAAVPR